MKRILIFTKTLLVTLLFIQPVWANINGSVKLKDGIEKTMNNSEEEWKFYSVIKKPTTEELIKHSSSHKLGKKAAYLYDVFKELYITKEEVVPGDPTLRTVIRKPDIYNAVRSIEKELTREVKKKERELSEAQQQFEKVLEISLAALESNVPSFEAALQANKKNTNELLAIFQRAELKQLY